MITRKEMDERKIKFIEQMKENEGFYADGLYEKLRGIRLFEDVILNEAEKFAFLEKIPNAGILLTCFSNYRIAKRFWGKDLVYGKFYLDDIFSNLDTYFFIGDEDAFIEGLEELLYMGYLKRLSIRDVDVVDDEDKIIGETKSVSFLIDYKSIIDFCNMKINEYENSLSNHKKIVEKRDHISKGLMLKVLRKTNCKCAYCGKSLNGKMEIDHIFPISKGGLDLASNMIAACRSCNNMKRDKSIAEFRYYFTCKNEGLQYFSKDIRDSYKEKGMTLPQPKPVRFYVENLNPYFFALQEI